MTEFEASLRCPSQIRRSNGLRRSRRQALWVHTVGNVYVAIDEDWCRSTNLTRNCDVASITAPSLRCDHSHDHDRRAIRTRNLAPSIRREPKLLTDQAVSFPTRRYWGTTNRLRLLRVAGYADDPTSAIVGGCPGVAGIEAGSGRTDIADGGVLVNRPPREGLKPYPDYTGAAETKCCSSNS